MNPQKIIREQEKPGNEPVLSIYDLAHNPQICHKLHLCILNPKP